MISVIVPVYNVEKYLRRCVDSILAQTYRDLEIILVDDGSTDGCPEICGEYAEKDSRIRVIHKANGGVSEARNAGLEAASGEWIGFVDSDDFVLPEMYETLHRACVERDVPVAVCGRRVIDERGAVLRHEFCLPQPVLLSAEEALRSLLLVDGVYCDSGPCDKLYKSALFDGIRFPLAVRYEDQNVVPRVLYRAGRIFQVGKPLYIYRKQKDSFTLQPFNSHSIDEVRQAEIVRAFIEEHDPELAREAAYFAYYRAGFPLCKAARCTDAARKEDMRTVLNTSRRYLPQVLGGALTVKHKLWYLKNYAVLKCRLRLWK